MPGRAPNRALSKHSRFVRCISEQNYVVAAVWSDNSRIGRSGRIVSARTRGGRGFGYSLERSEWGKMVHVDTGWEGIARR